LAEHIFKCHVNTHIDLSGVSTEKYMQLRFLKTLTCARSVPWFFFQESAFRLSFIGTLSVFQLVIEQIDLSLD
jgi:hypothetical protein